MNFGEGSGEKVGGVKKIIEATTECVRRGGQRWRVPVEGQERQERGGVWMRRAIEADVEVTDDEGRSRTSGAVREEGGEFCEKQFGRG